MTFQDKGKINYGMFISVAIFKPSVHLVLLNVFVNVNLEF